jgi:hypothetical protein
MQTHLFLRLFLGTVALISCAAQAQPNALDMSGSIGYNLAGSLTLSVERIDNNRPAGTYSGGLAIGLWATLYPYEGYNTAGYTVGSAQLDEPLEGQHFFSLVHEVTQLTRPPAGVYNMVMVLFEYDGTRYQVRDWYNFPSRQTFGTAIPPVPIITSPLRTNAAVGQAFRYRITAANGPLEYRAGNLPGGLVFNRRTGVISGTPTNSGTSSVSISAANLGGAVSRTLKIVVAQKPVFQLQPSSTAADAGANVSLTGTAAGYPNVRYQWLRNGNPVSGATSSSYNINNVQIRHAGTYRLVAGNFAGSVTSAPADLVVCSYSFTPPSAIFDASGGSNTAFVSVAGGCSWTVFNTNSWISITAGGTNNGDGAFDYSVQPNTGDRSRVGYLQIGPRLFTISQPGIAAPAGLSGQSLVISVTNGTGVFATNGTFVLVTATSGNQYTFADLSGALTNDTGTWTFVQSPPDAGTLTLSNDVDVITTMLTFSNFTAGSFSSTNIAGDSQTGTFTMTAAKPDLNHDGFADILLQNSNGISKAWFTRGTALLGSGLVRNGRTIGATAVCAGDFNADGSTDILFQNGARELTAWLMNGATSGATALIRNGTAAPSGWRAVAAADVNRDGYTDIIFQTSARAAMVWFLNKTNYLATGAFNNGGAANAGWRLAGVGDFNKDREMDLLWQHADGRLAAWMMIGTNLVGVVTLRGSETPGVRWRAVGADDRNFDGNVDVLFQHDTGKFMLWNFDGLNFLGTSPVAAGLSPGSQWRAFSPR